MSANISSASITQLFKRLNSKLVYAQAAPVELVVCGGAALIAARLVTRSTRDVDILALAHVEGTEVTLLPRGQLPEELKRLAGEIAIELGIDADWLNFGPSPLFDIGLPPGLTTRLKKTTYGACLKVHFISRIDQVHFKIFAAMDPKEGTRHLSDLLDIEPSVDEVNAAVSWLLGRKVSAQFKTTLKQVLERIGHESIARTI